jgi:hypothetical protein
MLQEISELLLRADHDPDVRCIVLTGSGRAFCAGLDLQAQMAGPKGGLGNLGGGDGGGFTGEFDLRSAPPVVLHNIDTPTVCALNAARKSDSCLRRSFRIAARTPGSTQPPQHPSGAVAPGCSRWWGCKAAESPPITAPECARGR